MEVAPFFVDFHHFLSIFTIFYRFSRFTHFCRDLHFVAIYALFPQIFFGQNSLLRNITRFCMYAHRQPGSVTFRRHDGCEWCQLPGDVVTVFWVGKWLCNLSKAGKGRQTGAWRYQLKTFWCCYCCWCWWWGSCWQQFVADLEADVWS